MSIHWNKSHPSADLFDLAALLRSTPMFSFLKPSRERSSRAWDVLRGSLASTVLTLVVLPTYYTLVDDFGVYLSRLWFVTSPDRQQAPAEVD